MYAPLAEEPGGHRVGFEGIYSNLVVTARASPCEVAHTRSATANMATPQTIPDQPTSSQPAELCGYSVVETLAPDASYLAIGPGGRGVTLKKLDPDCLYRGLLPPEVHDRLSRVRELAH